MKRTVLLLKMLFLVLGMSLLSTSQLKAQTWMDHFNDALAAIGKGDYEAAIVSYEKALPGVKQTFGTEHEYYSLCLNQLAQLYEFTGRYDRAEQLFLEAVSLARKKLGPEHADYAKIIAQLGEFYRNINQNEKAEELFLESAAIYKNLLAENSVNYAWTLNEMAQLYANMGQSDKAEDLYLQSISILKVELGDKSEDYASCISDLADLYEKMIEYKKAESLYKEAIAIRKAFPYDNKSLYATSLNCLAGLYIQQELFAKAEPLMLEAIEVEKKTIGETHPAHAGSIQRLAVVYTGMGEYSKAEQFYLQALDIIKKGPGEDDEQYAVILNFLGDHYNSQHQFDKAEKCLLQAVGILKNAIGEFHPNYEITVNNLALFYERNAQFEKAAQWYKTTESILLKNIENNFEFLSESEKEKYCAKVLYNFELFQGFYYRYYQQNKSVGKPGFDIQLATRGLILNSENQSRVAISSSGDTALIRLNERWKSIKINIAQQYSKPLNERNINLKKWEEEANALEKELIKKSSDFAKQQKSSQPKWNDIKDRLKPNEAAIEYISFSYHNGINWTDSVLYVAVLLTRNDTIPVYIPLFEEKQLKGLFQGDTMRTFANLLYTDAQVRTVENEISYGDSLYKLVWKPIEPYLKKVSNVYYSPSGLLHNLNFNAIPNGETTVLSDKYMLERLTSTSKILDKESSFNPISVSLFGGINYEVEESELKKLANNNKRKQKVAFSYTRSVEDTASRSGFNYLAGSKKEVDNISNLLIKNKIAAYVYTENKGTEEAVKNLDEKNSPSILHFSTHGFFFQDRKTKKISTSSTAAEQEPIFTYSDNPLFRSGLIMAGADYVWRGNPPIDGVEDGILTAYEISDLYLPNTKLVVMSACETGLGEIKGSEGVYGLQRAFKKAGVEYIIMTLWQVLDKETTEFMTLFYENLIDKKSIPDAFKAAQDTMKEKYRNEPYKWAAFVLIK